MIEATLHLPRRGFTLDVSFELDAGVTALCGPSGNGKSTVLGLIAGTLVPHDAR